jgi:anaerobic ribonucleoside-triphosphate reductase
MQCYHILTIEDLLPDQKCPECKTTVIVMCQRDHCHCSHDITETLAYCPDCKAPMCPLCESHDVEQISRVTGYLGAVSGWSAGKAQELKDRVRTNIAVDGFENGSIV